MAEGSKLTLRVTGKIRGRENRERDRLKGDRRALSALVPWNPQHSTANYFPIPFPHLWFTPWLSKDLQGTFALGEGSGNKGVTAPPGPMLRMQKQCLSG